MDILYYSNYCTHSQKIIQTLVKGNMADKLSFVCIDKRVVDKKTNQVFVILENGSKVVLPPNIHSVPALLLIKQNYRVLLGDEIMQHMHPQLKQLNEKAVGFHGEPMSFSLANFGAIVSEQYTDYNMSPEELSAKGKGANRQMYNYVSASDDIKFINTPPDNYRPDKLANNVTIDSLQQQRLDEIGSTQPGGRPLGI